MNTTDAIGWLAAGLLLLAFYSTSACRLRACAVAANLAFIAYGAMAHLPPVLILHLVLLPINTVRLLRASRTPDTVSGPQRALRPSDS